MVLALPLPPQKDFPLPTDSDCFKDFVANHFMNFQMIKLVTLTSLAIIGPRA
jgi:hypothetical protein